MSLKLDMQHRGLKLDKVYINLNGDPGLTLTFYGKVKFGNLGFSIGKIENSGFQPVT